MIDDPHDDELSVLLEGIRSGDEESQTKFWNLHFGRLVSLARRKMSNIRLRTHDEEDFAISAIDSFYHGLAKRRFDAIRTNNELWKLLTTIVVRKIAKQRKKHFSQKRGGGQVRGESFFMGASADDERTGIGNISGGGGSPYLEAEFLDTCEKLYALLEDETTRTVARLSMEGYSIDEITEHLGCVRRTVERKLKKIREKWAAEGNNETK